MTIRRLHREKICENLRNLRMKLFFGVPHSAFRIFFLLLLLLFLAPLSPAAYVGNSEGAAPTTATTGTISVPLTSPVITITPTGACTFNGTGGTPGARMSFIVTTSGTSSFVLTWGTNFKSTGTLATGTVTAKVFTVSFVCKDGTLWTEIARTIAM